MIAVILAAGRGSRLSPLTDNSPKCTLSLNGERLIDSQVRLLKSLGAKQIIVAAGYLAEHFGQIDAEIVLITDYQSSNMVWTLRSIFEQKSELLQENDLIVSYGDILYSPSVLKRLQSSRDPVTIAVDSNWESYWSQRSEFPLEDLETLELDSAGRVLEIGNKPKSLSEIQGQYIGLSRFSNGYARTLGGSLLNMDCETSVGGRTARTAHMTDLLRFIIKGGQDVASCRFSEPWIELDTIGDFYSEVNRLRHQRIINELDSAGSQLHDLKKGEY